MVTARLDPPAVRVVCMADVTLADGVERMNIGGVEVAVIYAARTVVDCFRFRNKIGLDVALEARLQPDLDPVRRGTPALPTLHLRAPTKLSARGRAPFSAPIRPAAPFDVTFARRQTAMLSAMPLGLGLGLGDAFADDATKHMQWRAFLRKNKLELIDLCGAMIANRERAKRFGSTAA